MRLGLRNLWNLGSVALLLVVLGCNCGDKIKELANKSESTPRPSSSPGSTSTVPSTKKGEYDLKMEQYDQLKVGMPRSEAESILGGKGTEISSSTGGGMRFSVNKWEGDNYKSVILSFRNDKIMTKSQVGLDK